MRTLYALVIILFFSAVAFAQDNFLLPGQFTISNHGKDYPTKDAYSFGDKVVLDDVKEIRDLRYAVLDNSRSYNGIVVAAYKRLSPSGWKEGEMPAPIIPKVKAPNKNGEFRFDWMKSATEVDMRVIDLFLDYLDSIPDDAIVLMYSGYYHAIDKMPAEFFKAIERFGSNEIRNVKANSVWAFIGTSCGEFNEVAEAITQKHDEVISISQSVHAWCAPLTSSMVNPSFEAGIRVFPNPAVNVLNISVRPEQEVLVTIFSLTGKVYITTTQVQELDISELPKGIFIVQVKTREKVYSSRFTKK